MGPEEYRSRQELADRLNIHFLDPTEPEDWPAHWSTTRSRLFHDITKLGSRRYHEFDETVSVDSIEKPWRRQVKKRAIRIAQLATKCRREGRNEAGWRACIEPEVLYRFTVEVSCPDCRQKLWRSEIEAAIESTEGQAASLQERRKKRLPCTCPARWGETQYDYGINMIFSDRAETSIHYDPPLRIESYRRSAKKYEQPDRVYGLLQTENFKVLLNSADKRFPVTDATRALRQTLEVSPFKRDLEPLLFPFLLIEAKPDDVGHSAAAEMQSVFCIGRLLMLQDALRAATGDESLWQTGPLVWFFVWRGHEWSIKGSFIDDIDRSAPRYCILDLWNGDIRQQSGALQLLLIVDYIFDWARDVYRQSILNELSILAAEEMRFTDPDLFSTIEQRQSRIPSDPPNFSRELRGGNGLVEENKELDSSLMNNRQSLGVVRDASVIQSRFLALHITEDDVETFMLSFPSAEASNAAVRAMAQCFHNSWRVTAEALSGLELMWTGFGPRNDDHTSADVFYLKLVILMHVSMDWVPVRQLTYLAISEVALQRLMLKAGLLNVSSGLRNYFQNIPVIERSRIEGFLASVMEQSIVDTLTAAISVLCLSSTCCRRAGRISAKWLIKKSNNYCAGFSLDKSPVALELVARIYESHKIGRREPTDPYIRFSQSETSQTVVSREFCMWPRLEPIYQDTNGCALVDGLNSHTNSSRHCLYNLTGSDVSTLDIPNIAHILSEGGLYYSTLQLDDYFLPSEYLQYLNRPTKTSRLWRETDALASVKEWIEGLKESALVSEAGKTVISPIVLSSGEESATDDYMDED